jgi:hypothetical protein
MVGSTAAKSHYFISKVQSQTDVSEGLKELKNLPFP